MSPSKNTVTAVDDFLDRLRPGWSPPAYFVVYMNYLRTQPALTQAEIWHVEMELRRLLGRLYRSVGGNWRLADVYRPMDFEPSNER